jgi:hypothetical protein
MDLEGLSTAQPLATRYHENLAGRKSCLKYIKFVVLTVVKIHIVPIGLWYLAVWYVVINVTKEHTAFETSVSIY